MFETKTFPFKIEEIKAEGDRWEFSGYASVFGNVDRGDDVVMRGAFEKSLARRKRRPLLWQHNVDEPIGIELELREDDHGLFGRWQLVDTTKGADAYKLLKAGVIDSMSIGYIAEQVEFDEMVRKLIEIDVLENSVVTLAMNEAAIITTVKGYGLSLDEHAERVRDAALELMARLDAGTARRVKEGRAISSARRSRLSSSSGKLREVADEIDGLLAETDPEKAVDPPEEKAPPVGINLAYELACRRSLLRGRVELPA